MFKKIIVMLFIILSLSAVYPKIIEQTSFDELGVERGQNLCKTYEFNKLKEETGSKLIANIVFENYIPTKSNLEVTLFFNDKELTTLKETEILAENKIEINEKQEAKNYFKLCVNNNALPKVIISKRSNIGTYLLGEIREEVDFYQKVLTTETYSSSLIPIEIYVYNSGQDKLNINLNYASEKFLKNSNLETVSGQTNYSGPIEPGQTITLKYYLKTNKNIDFYTPRAELKYKDEFGIENIIYAKQEIINVRDNQNKIEVYVDLEKDVLVKTPKVGKIILKNVTQTDIKNINIETNFDGKIIVSQRQLGVLKGFEVIEIPFEITVEEMGQYTFNSTVYFNLGEKENGVNSQTIIVNANEKKDYVKETIGVFLIISIVIYIWIVRL